MVTQTNKIWFRRGMTLVETLVAITILLIALIGTFTFRYHATLDGRKADAQATAARIALMFCESWKGINGDVTYDPVNHLGSELKVAKGAGPANPDDFTPLGSYTVVFDDGVGVDNYTMTLSWKDVKPGLRALNVIVAWALREHEGDGNDVIDKSFNLTVYTQTY
jgi:prepilin-type N-terminal cleavage/methylation domain-containing protein